MYLFISQLHSAHKCLPKVSLNISFDICIYENYSNLIYKNRCKRRHIKMSRLSLQINNLNRFMIAAREFRESSVVVCGQSSHFSIVLRHSSCLSNYLTYFRTWSLISIFCNFLRFWAKTLFKRFWKLTLVWFWRNWRNDIVALILVAGGFFSVQPSITRHN